MTHNNKGLGRCAVFAAPGQRRFAAGARRRGGGQHLLRQLGKVFRAARGQRQYQRRAGQDHFNARESGNVTRAKRRPAQLSTSDQANVKRFMPY